MSFLKYKDLEIIYWLNPGIGTRLHYLWSPKGN